MHGYERILNYDGEHMNPALRKLLKELLFRAPVSVRRYFFPGYEYQMRPSQLCFLCECVEQTRNVPGAVVEVGCAFGTTTLFLAQYMDAQEIEKDYYALDTFSGFVQEDIEHEVLQRGKPRSEYTGRFVANKQAWFDDTMRIHDVQWVRSIQADANRFDFSTLGPIAFCLLDLDLYRPIHSSLAALHAALSPGGRLVVDDCDPANTRWDGADQAYKEFCNKIGCAPRVVLGKLGVIEKAG